MLFVKNLMFLDGAIATLAPDLDLFAEVEASPCSSPPSTASGSWPSSGSSKPRTGPRT